MVEKTKSVRRNGERVIGPGRPVTFRTAYGEKRNDVVVSFDGETSLTKQSFADECDINNIMARYRKTGLIEHVNLYNGQYGEFADIDFHQAMNTVIKAEEMFGTVPSDIRERFNNDPGAFLDFVTNEENSEAIQQMGLGARAPETAPAPPAPVAADTPPEPAPEPAEGPAP